MHVSSTSGDEKAQKMPGWRTATLRCATPSSSGAPMSLTLPRGSRVHLVSFFLQPSITTDSCPSSPGLKQCGSSNST